MLQVLFLGFLVNVSASGVASLYPHDLGGNMYGGFSRFLATMTEGTSQDPRCSHLFFIEKGSSLAAAITESLLENVAPLAVAVFTPTGNEKSSNETQREWLSVTTKQARELRMASWCLMITVVSDDPIFLSTFAELAMKNRLMLSSTKLVAMTQFPLYRLESYGYFHKVFSRMDAMIIIFADVRSLRGRVYIYLPNISPGEGRVLLGTMSHTKTLTYHSDLPLFPDKYSKFLRRPVLKIATEWLQERQNRDTVCNQRFVKYFEQGLNFTCAMVKAEDKLYGTKNPDGTWSGIVGMVIRDEADLNVALVAYSHSREQVVDHTVPLMVQYLNILGKLGMPEVDPWSFYLPLDLYVWLGILSALLVVPSVMFLLSWGSCSPHEASRPGWSNEFFHMLRVLLQQDISVSTDLWHLRLVTATWMLVALVLVRSYASNLISVMAVRYVRQPFQSLRNVLDDPRVTIIWQTNSTSVLYFRSAESGIFREVAKREEEGLIKFLLIHELSSALDTYLRRTDYVLVSLEVFSRMMIGNYFTKRGRCDFYTSKERFLPEFLTMFGQKGSPIVPMVNKRIIALQESGLYDMFIESSIINFTSCANTPTRITESTPLSLLHIWGILVLLAGSHVTGLFVLLCETLW